MQARAGPALLPVPLDASVVVAISTSTSELRRVRAAGPVTWLLPRAHVRPPPPVPGPGDRTRRKRERPQSTGGVLPDPICALTGAPTARTDSPQGGAGATARTAVTEPSRLSVYPSPARPHQAPAAPDTACRVRAGGPRRGDESHPMPSLPLAGPLTRDLELARAPHAGGAVARERAPAPLAQWPSARKISANWPSANTSRKSSSASPPAITRRVSSDMPRLYPERAGRSAPAR